MSVSRNEILNSFVGPRLQHYGSKLFEDRLDTETVTPPETILPHPQAAYFHIPFCDGHLCDMCPFVKVRYRQDWVAKYMASLALEVGRYSHLDFDTIHIGGGTPALVLPELVEAFENNQIKAKEVSIEAHPQDINDKTIEYLLALGVGRLSMGIQSFKPHLLALMGRSNGDNPIASLELAQKYFLVNADLIFNVPNQKVADFLEDLNILIGLGIAQITCYPLMHTPDSSSQVDNSSEAAFYQAMLKTFAAAGYKPVTPWCFAQTDQVQQGEYISNGITDYVGIGASAISKLGPNFSINTPNLRHYSVHMGANESAVVGQRLLNPNEEAQYQLLTGLFGMHFDMSRMTHPKLQKALIRSEILFLRAAGYVTVQNEVARPTEKGMRFLSGAMRDFYTGLNQFRHRYKTQIGYA